MSRITPIGAALAFVLSTAPVSGQTPTDVDWPYYLGDGSSQYSTLDQVTPGNVHRLEVAWTHRSGGADPNGRSQIQTSPIVVGGILYGASPELQHWESGPGWRHRAVFRIATSGAIPYGMAIDKNDNVWSGLWNGGKIAKFDTTTRQWTEFSPPTYPANIRRGVGIDSQNKVWFGIYAAGRPHRCRSSTSRPGG